jgi:hypothetical protein
MANSSLGVGREDKRRTVGGGELSFDASELCLDALFDGQKTVLPCQCDPRKLGALKKRHVSQPQMGEADSSCRQASQPSGSENAWKLPAMARVVSIIDYRYPIDIDGLHERTKKTSEMVSRTQAGRI